MEEGEEKLKRDAGKNANTIHRKLIAMLASIRNGMHRGWTSEVIRMVCDDELHFERRGRQVWAIRRVRDKRIDELILAAIKK